MLLKGDCIEVMKAMKPNSVDAIVTDPPYGLEFMGKEWDKFVSTRPPYRDGKNYYKQQTDKRKEGLKGQYDSFNHTYEYNAETLEHRNYFQKWCCQWLTEAYRVLKPGGSMLVMGGTRTSHRLACAIEDAGFIIKDTILWIFGSGFPKCQDITPMIDGKILGITTKQVKERREIIGKNPNDRKKRENTLSDYGLQGGVGKGDITKPLTGEAKHWDGFKVGGIKPAYEPIIWAVKPPEGSYVDNVLKWGVGAVNVAETRINGNKGNGVWGTSNKTINPDRKFNASPDMHAYKSEQNPTGRFPANVILSHHPECVQVGVKRVKGERHSGKPGHGKDGQVYGKGIVFTGNTKCYVDPDGYEQVESWDCHFDCPIRLLDEQSGDRSDNKRKKFIQPRPTTGNGAATFTGKGHLTEHYPDSGGASRFFYCAKSSRSERNAGLEGMEEKACGRNQSSFDGGEILTGSGNKRSNYKTNSHPTVKPIKLFEWLIKLVTREGQIVLDPFIGSGTTAIAAHNARRKCIGIEKEEEYLEIARRRATHWRSRPRQMEII